MDFGVFKKFLSRLLTRPANWEEGEMGQLPHGSVNLKGPGIPASAAATAPFRRSWGAG